ncbi:ABC transporter substrate-binding protein [Arthrobacter pigmenti]
MKRTFLTSTVLASLLATTACGGDSAQEATSGAGTSGAESMTTIRVAETAGAPSAFLQYGVDQGFFEEEGLDVQVDVSAGGAAAIPGVVSGDLQLAGSNVVSVMLAASKGLPVSMVAAGTRTAETVEEDFSKVLVKGDSNIDEPQDLAGKTIAVNTLENISEVSIKAALESENVDLSNIEFVELGFPDMVPALENEQVDAVMAIEPFVTIGLNNGHRAVLSPYVQAQPGLQIGSYVATKAYIEENPDTIEAFRRGVAATGQSIAEDTESFREALPELASIQPDAVGSMNLPVWKANVDTESLRFLEEKMRQYGITSERLDVSTVVAPGAE